MADKRWNAVADRTTRRRLVVSLDLRRRHAGGHRRQRRAAHLSPSTPSPAWKRDDAYRKGLAYNTTLAAARAQQERGWQAEVAFTPRTDEARAATAAELTVGFVDRDGQPLRDLDVVAVLIRPTSEGIDVSVELDHRGQGVYGAAVALPLPGQWDVRIVAHRGADDFQETRRIIVP